MTYAAGDTLVVKPDRKIKPVSGNAIIAGPGKQTGTWVIFTDFGNTVTLTDKELATHYIVSRRESVARWMEDRELLRQDQKKIFENMQRQQSLAHPRGSIMDRRSRYPAPKE